MKQIKYRGLTVPERQWISSDEEFHEVYLNHAEKTAQINGRWVKYGSVSQFIGLKDKNEKEVFCGDVIRCSRGCPHEVIWLAEYAGTFGGGMPAWYLSGLNEGYAWTGAEEIIGNVFENPELLEAD